MNFLFYLALVFWGVWVLRGFGEGRENLGYENRGKLGTQFSKMGERGNLRFSRVKKSQMSRCTA